TYLKIFLAKDYTFRKHNISRRIAPCRAWNGGRAARLGAERSGRRVRSRRSRQRSDLHWQAGEFRRGIEHEACLGVGLLAKGGFCNLMAHGELSRMLRSEDSMAKALKTGDRVAWRSSGGGSVGRVER